MGKKKNKKKNKIVDNKHKQNNHERKIDNNLENIRKDIERISPKEEIKKENKN